jgi:hypothetical protein
MLFFVLSDRQKVLTFDILKGNQSPHPPQPFGYSIAILANTVKDDL